MGIARNLMLWPHHGVLPKPTRRPSPVCKSKEPLFFFFFFFFVRTTQQNKIPVYCWTLFHTYIKQAKKINSNFIDKKKGRKKKKPLSLAFLTISYKPTTYSTARYIHKKSYWNARNKIGFFCCHFCFFFTRFFFSFEIIMNMVTPQVRSEVGQENALKASSHPSSSKMADP